MAMELQFININDKQAAKKPNCTRGGRSHAMKRSHYQKRLTNARNLNNFRHLTPETIKNAGGRVCENQRTAMIPSPKISIAVAKFDPFESLGADTSKLQTLLATPQARQAGEPIVRFHADMGYQGVRIVFRSTLADPALLNAILMTLTFASTEDPEDALYLAYRGQTIKWVNERLSQCSSAANAATIGVILLLVGIETRLQAPSNVKAHMQGIQSILQLCDSMNIRLHDAIKRAVFWQDLFSAILTGSTRLLHHESFPELTWHHEDKRKLGVDIPPGFDNYATLLGEDFLGLVLDILSLQSIRENEAVYPDDAVSVMHLDNQQASIESRLYDMEHDPFTRTNPILECCTLACFCCTYMLFTEIWDSDLLPFHVSSNLLQKVQELFNEEELMRNWELFVWILSVGGTSSKPGRTRKGFAVLLQSIISQKNHMLDQPTLEIFLKDFLWSPSVFGAKAIKFWSNCPSVVMGSETGDVILPLR